MIKTQHAADGEICVVVPGTERLTAANATGFKEEVFALIDQKESRLLIDLGGLSFIDSSGIGAMVGLLKKLGVRGDIAICGLNDDVRRMFSISRMDRVFSTFKDRETAVAAMRDKLS